MIPRVQQRIFHQFVDYFFDCCRGRLTNSAATAAQSRRRFNRRRGRKTPSIAASLEISVTPVERWPRRNSNCRDPKRTSARSGRTDSSIECASTPKPKYGFPNPNISSYAATPNRRNAKFEISYWRIPAAFQPQTRFAIELGAQVLFGTNGRDTSPLPPLTLVPAASLDLLRAYICWREVHRRQWFLETEYAQLSAV